MWILLLLGSLVSAVNAADSDGVPVCVHDSRTAKTALAALYTAEKAYFYEHQAYSQNLLEIGMYEPGDSQRDCDWKYWSIRAYLRGNEFVGTAVSSLTRETWEIDERRDVRRVK